MWLNLSGQKTVRELSTYVDEVLKEQLQRINGVGDIQLGASVTAGPCLAQRWQA